MWLIRLIPPSLRLEHLGMILLAFERLQQLTVRNSLLLEPLGKVNLLGTYDGEIAGGTQARP
ncbi:MAG: hypothetical protein HN556_19625 [Gammaproteobacteria bacterium]|nr:hypothetical protein [Gammaproteobacteria bacterium]